MDRKVKIDYIFSKNKKIGSWIIRKGTAFLCPDIKNTPSHVAVLIDEKWIIESTVEHGFRFIPYKKWLEINEETHKIKCLQNWTFQKIKSLYKPLKNHKYDYLGVVYFGWRVALRKLFRVKMPKENLLDHENKYFCCEIISKMTGVSYKMTAPVQLLDKIQKAIEEFKTF